MTVLLLGVLMFASVLGLFYLKDRRRSSFLSRLAYSGLIMRFTVVSVAMIAIGLLLVANRLFS